MIWNSDKDLWLVETPQTLIEFQHSLLAFRHPADFCFDGVDYINFLGILRVSLRHLAIFPQFCFLYLVTFLRLDALLYVVQCKSPCIVSLLCEVSTFLPSCQSVPSTQLTPNLQR